MPSANVAEAIRLLNRPKNSLLDPATTAALCGRLKRDKEFGYARQLYAELRAAQIDDPGQRLKFRQQHALCTYKDSDLASEQGLDKAIQILDSDPDDPVRETRNQETLGIAGAIHKRKWEVDGCPGHLERALAYYLKGFKIDPVGDHGYTGINAAYVLDLLAHLEEAEAVEAGADLGRPSGRREAASAIREELVAKLKKLYEDPKLTKLKTTWWFVATLAEACFGLECYAAARTWLERRRECDPEDWELEATARQLAALARLHAGPTAAARDIAGSEADAVIREFLDDKAEGALTAFVGRVGLALSGGGFRASFFHIGVLAKLAELDLLRHVEVLSCVSGGSIVGVQYYLELRKELQRRQHRELSRDCYIKIVKRVEQAFVAGVDTNIRMSVFKSPSALLKMVTDRSYNRTTRIGELFEEELYSRVDDGAGNTPRSLRDLKVIPAGSETFHPRRDNWWRRAKVPILVLNATTLNTGHNWQFTATYMGEPPGYLDKEIDANYRLRRLHYDGAPSPYGAVRLGHAVAASACVPGLFRPIVLDDLYPGKVVRLVDGGVTDNQGIYGLLEQDCTVMLVSDASGQTEAEDNSAWLSTSVPLRSNNILMGAVRSGIYRELDARRRSSRLRELMYVHLKKELEGAPVTWRKEGVPAPVPAELASASAGITSYGVPKAVQARLAALRTDLDAFSETETKGLMLSGYLMAAKEVPASIRSLPLSSDPPVDWSFRSLEREFEPRTRSAERYAELLEELEVGRYRMFRGIRRSAPMKALLSGWSWLRRKFGGAPLTPAEASQA